MSVDTESYSKGGVRMNWKERWIDLFGTTERFGLNVFFLLSLTVVLLIVILMNVVFWSMNPKIDKCKKG